MKFGKGVLWIPVLALSVVLASPVIAGCGHDHDKQSHSMEKEATQALATTGEELNIVGTAVAAGSFTTLVAAVEAAGLVETLQGEGPFTVFAPTDEAFAKLPEGTVEELLKPQNKGRLQDVLTYHVVAGKVTSHDVAKLESAKTVQGQEISIQVKDGKVMVDGALVTTVDIEASNGVIHVIDSVILPEM